MSDEFWNIVVTLELGAGAIFTFAKLISWAFTENSYRQSPVFRIAYCGHILLFFLLFLAFQGQWLTEGKAVLAIGPIMPGSYVTRLTALDCARWLRRLIEPSWWIIILSLATLSATTSSRKSKLGYLLSSALFLAALCAESIVFAYSSISDYPISSFLIFIHLSLTQLAIISYLLSIPFFHPQTKDIFLLKNILKTIPIFLSIPVALILFLSSLHPQANYLSLLANLKTGIHYYSWFPENWVGGFAYEKLSTPVLPELGKYRSSDEAVFSSHVKMIKDAGIDFIVFDWWPKRREIRKRIERHISRENSLNGLKFTLMLEIQDIRESKDPKLFGEDSNVIYLSEARKDRLLKSFEFVTKRYASHPDFLRINNRPVIFIYTTRQLFGPVFSAFREIKDHVKKVTGEDLYLVADEVFYNVASFSRKHGVILKKELEPEYDRLAAFDAITAYNPYESQKTNHGGSKGAETFIDDTASMYRAYRKYATTVGIPFFPGIIPGYNDRGIRPKEDHYVVPRDYQVTENNQIINKSFFKESLNRLAFRFLDEQYPIFTVTSFNEWNEGTQIEASTVTPNTTSDISESGNKFTNGEIHSGYGNKYLQELSSSLSSGQSQ